jgi:5-methylcytosine-specific restriction endonuclease McrA
MKKGSKMSEESKIKIRIARARQVFSKESNIKRSKALKGIPKPNGFSENLKRKRAERKLRLGYINSPETRIKIGLASRGRICSKESRRKHSEGNRGSRSYYWEGGITPLNLAIRRTYKYRLWRSDVFQRDNYTCQFCMSNGCYVEADHIKAFCLILKENNIKTVEEALLCEELWNINNGRTLCKPCHKKTETHAGRAKNLINNK